MRIAQVSPLIESVPPRKYGGTERIVSYLTDELLDMGHDVTLFATGDSITRAKLEAVYPMALRLDAHVMDHIAPHLILFEKVLAKSGEFDIVHFHTGYLHLPCSRHLNVANLTTHHGRLDLTELYPLFREFSELPAVSISNAQRHSLPWINWQSTVYNGVPADLYAFHPLPGKYLAFLGRISPEKGVDLAIAIAQRIDMDIVIAAKVDKVDTLYFNDRIKPLLKDPRVKYIGEIGDEDKSEFLGNARALIFPIDWSEPFGMVMIEAMACGTPIIAFCRGSVPEVINQDVTGYIVNDIYEATDAVQKLDGLDRQLCRKEFETRFTAKRMAEDYLTVYQNLMNNRCQLHQSLENR